MSITNKNILITGGTGTVGEALLNKLSTLDVNNIYVFSRDEQKQDLIMRKFKDKKNISFVIGDIRNYESVDSVIRKVDIVFHVAAMKIVRICELNPFETLQTNIIGTENIIKSAISNNIEQVVFTSTDKAANPSSVMGISKLFCERLISCGNMFPGVKTKLSGVRFGNILGSRGCVLDLFINQIKTLNYVTVTDESMTRFIMSIDEAVNFLISSTSLADNGEILVPKMPCIKIVDLAKVLIEYLSPTIGVNTEDIKIKITSKQAVEKIHEELISDNEAERTIELDSFYSILPVSFKEPPAKLERGSCSKLKELIISSNPSLQLNREGILDFLTKNNLI